MIKLFNDYGILCVLILALLSLYPFLSVSVDKDILGFKSGFYCIDQSNRLIRTPIAISFSDLPENLQTVVKEELSNPTQDELDIIAEKLIRLNQRGFEWDAVYKTIQPLAEVEHDVDKFLSGLIFVEELISEIELTDSIDYKKLNERFINLLSSERLGEYSEDLEHFETNFSKAMNWILELQPILSHEVIEEWNENAEDEYGNYINFGLYPEPIRPEDAAEYVKGRVTFYAGGFLKIGVGSFVLDNRGASLFICPACKSDINSVRFQAFFKGQKWGKEIAARIFKTTYEISKLMNYRAPWAFSYYFKNNTDEATEERTDENFEDSERFKIIDSFFKSLGFVYVRSSSGNYPEGFMQRYQEEISALDSLRSFWIGNKPGGGWVMLLEELDHRLTDSNWIEWFYRHRIEGVSEELDWQEFRSNTDWETVFHQIKTEHNQALLSILKQLVEQMPAEDLRVSEIEEKLQELEG